MINRLLFNLKQAQAYEVVGNTDDIGFGGRDRLGFTIVSQKANTFEQLAQTAMKAAIDKQGEADAEVIYIKLYSDRKSDSKF
ncbi:hypothetical protein [Abyssogena phaseoliformis symbiont]|uniref:DUF4875 domain-containing protein n=1 Tax=Abyssogena phaseoliformis symbiont TaxID=596095 RepID=UPI001915BE78|nr:hypothetical protein [Abyssogena phaseoliformis symbiont]